MKQKERALSTKQLNVILANTAVLLMQTLHYHWNLRGAEFHDYHLLFDAQYKKLFEDLDLIAERIRAVQGDFLGAMKDMLKFSELQEDTGKLPKPSQMVVKLLQQYEFYIESMREKTALIEKDTTDYGTINMLQSLIESNEKTAWMLRSLTEK